MYISELEGKHQHLEERLGHLPGQLTDDRRPRVTPAMVISVRCPTLAVPSKTKRPQGAPNIWGTPNKWGYHHVYPCLSHMVFCGLSVIKMSS